MPEITDPRLLAELHPSAPQSPAGRGMVYRNPQQPYDMQRAAAGATTATAEAPFAGPQAAANLQKTQAEATAAAAAALKAQQDAKAGGLTAEQRGKLQAQLAGAQNLAGRINEIETRFNRDFSGNSWSALKEYLPGQIRPENQEFNDAGNSIMGDIAAAYGLTAQQQNTPAELKIRFGPFIPKATDRDDVIQAKIARLKEIAQTQTGQAQAQLSGTIGHTVQAGVTSDLDPSQADQGMTAPPVGSAPLPPSSAPQSDILEERPAGGENWQGAVVPQALSGVATGVANLLGAPVDLMAGANSGINSLLGTNLPTDVSGQVGGSEWWRDLGKQGIIAPLILPEGGGGAARAARRVGESVGAALLPVGATAQGIRQLGTGLGLAAGGGVGASVANEVAPGNPIAEVGGEILGSGLTGAGMFGLARRGATRAAEAAVPTIQQLKDQAGELYRQAEARGVVAGPNVTSNLAGKVRQIAQDEGLVSQTGRVSEAYPRASETMRILDDAANGGLDVKQMQVMRETLADAVGATKGKERRISSMMLRAFDEETTPLAPELAEARRVSSRYLQADRVNLAREVAEDRAGGLSQSSKENALRTDFRQLGTRITKGYESFNPAVEDAIKLVSRGDTKTNIARNLASFAPTRNPSSWVPGLGAGSSVGALAGDPVIGALVGGGTTAVGAIARPLATRWANRNAEIAELLARNGGELITPPIVTPDVQKMIAASLAGQVGGRGGN